MRTIYRPLRIRRLFTQHARPARPVRRIWKPIYRPPACLWLRAALLAMALSAGGILLAKPAAAVPGPD